MTVVMSRKWKEGLTSIVSSGLLQFCLVQFSVGSKVRVNLMDRMWKELGSSLSLCLLAVWINFMCSRGSMMQSSNCNFVIKSTSRVLEFIV